MLEKSSTIRLTDNDVRLAKQGTVSDRVKQSWGLTLDELKEIVDQGSYSLVTDDSSDS